MFMWATAIQKAASNFTSPTGPTQAAPAVNPLNPLLTTTSAGSPSTAAPAASGPMIGGVPFSTVASTIFDLIKGGQGAATQPATQPAQQTIMPITQQQATQAGPVGPTPVVVAPTVSNVAQTAPLGADTYGNGTQVSGYLQPTGPTGAVAGGVQRIASQPANVQSSIAQVLASLM